MDSKQFLQGKTVCDAVYREAVKKFEADENIKVLDVYEIPNQVMRDRGLIYKRRVVFKDKRTKNTIDCGWSF